MSGGAGEAGGAGGAGEAGEAGGTGDGGPVGLAAEVARLDWYHTLDLGSGIVTPGWFDTRAVADRVQMPASLAGRRCLDVGTFDGFWAFEMERRGACEVVAVDLLDPAAWDWPADSPAEAVAEIGRRKAGGRGFDLARAALGSSVRRVERSVYDLEASDPEVGTFDFVYLGSLLLHLRDPVRALACVRDVCAPDASILVVDAVDSTLSRLHRRRPVAHLDGRDRPWWWKPNVAGLVRMIEAGGFAVEGAPARLAMPAGPGQPRHRPSLWTLRSRAGREAALIARWGDPHAAVRARPRRGPQRS
ncbi:MAG: class I SAM-dependent methyltransferase [Acidimicrobiales bacterium]